MSGGESQWTDERLDQMLRDALQWEGDRIVREGPDSSLLMSELADRQELGTTVSRYALPLVALFSLALLVSAAVGGMLLWRPVEVPLLPSASVQTSAAPSVSISPLTEAAMPLGAFDRSEMEALLGTGFEETALVDGLLRYTAGIGGLMIEFVVDAETGAIVRSSGSLSRGPFQHSPSPEADGAILAWFDFLRGIDRQAADWLNSEFTAFSSALGEEVLENAQFGRLWAEFRTMLNYISGQHDQATWAVQAMPDSEFSGFLPPVGDGLLNVATDGLIVPLRWRLTDANGNPIVDLATVGVSVVDLDCERPATTHLIQEYATSSEAGLQNLGDGYYQYDFRPSLALTNACRTLRLDLGEGPDLYPIYRTVDFQFVD